MAVLALMLPVILAIAAYAINVVYMEAARTELQITTDVATRAAGRMLAVTGDEEQALVADEEGLLQHATPRDGAPHHRHRGLRRGAGEGPSLPSQDQDRRPKAGELACDGVHRE